MDKRLILKNGKIFTSDVKHPWADSVTICNGRFEAVGKAPEDDGEVIDLKGRTVLPGLIDSHTHIGLSVMMETNFKIYKTFQQPAPSYK